MHACFPERTAKIACHTLSSGEDAVRDQMRAFEAGHTERTEPARAGGD
jgi:hypothetical protein